MSNKKKERKESAERLDLPLNFQDLNPAIRELMSSVEGRAVGEELDFARDKDLTLEALERYGASAHPADSPEGVVFDFRGVLYVTPRGGSLQQLLAVALVFVLGETLKASPDATISQ